MSERSDLVESLQRHRFFLTTTARGLTDEQAALRTSVSELTVGGLIKHVTRVERAWAQFASGRPQLLTGEEGGGVEGHAESFRMLPGQTLAGLLDEYAAVAAETDELVRSTPDLDASYPLPPAPWFAPGARWSVRRVVLHIIAETAQHAGHADIIREGIDGAKTMG